MGKRDRGIPDSGNKGEVPRMKCIKCGGKTVVFNSRSNGYVRLRERQCEKCGYTFATEEKPVDLGKMSVAVYLNRMIKEMNSEVRGSGES